MCPTSRFQMDAIWTDFPCYDIPARAAISANIHGQLPRYASPAVASPQTSTGCQLQTRLGRSSPMNVVDSARRGPAPTGADDGNVSADSDLPHGMGVGSDVSHLSISNGCDLDRFSVL